MPYLMVGQVCGSAGDLGVSGGWSGHVVHFLQYHQVSAGACHACRRSIIGHKGQIQVTKISQRLCDGFSYGFLYDNNESEPCLR